MNDTQLHRRDQLAAHLRTEAITRHQSAPALAARLLELARQADLDPTAIYSPTLDAIIALAGVPVLNAERRDQLANYSTLQLDAAAKRAAFQRDQLPRFSWDRQARNEAHQHLCALVDARCGIQRPSAPMVFESRQDALNARRRHKRGGRW